MKNRIITLCFREIKKNYKRFLSLIIMSFLGVGVFVGLRCSPRLMIASLDKYYDDSNTYDVKVVSTLGLTDEDVEELKSLDLIEDSYGIHAKDVYFENDDTSYVIRLSAINNNINRITLKEGNLPENNSEIVVEKYMLEKTNLKIGDSIKINDPDNNIKNTDVKIVGTIETPLFITVGTSAISRGTSNIGSGKINFYGYSNDDLFDMEYYSEIYLTIKDAKDLITNDDDYNKLINYGLGEINAIKKYREKARYDEIYNRVMNEIIAEEKKGLSELDNANKQLNDYKNELDNGLTKLKNNKNKIENNKIQLNYSLSELNNSKTQIDNGYLKLNESKKELDDAREKIENELSKYGLSIEDIFTLIDLFNGKTVPIENFKKLVNDDNPYKEDIYKAIDYLYENNYIENINNLFIRELDEIKNNIISLIPKDFNNYYEVVNFINSINVSEVKDFVLKLVIDTNKVEELKKYIPNNIKNYDSIISFLDNYITSVDKIKELFRDVLNLKNAEVEINNSESDLIDANNNYNEAYKKYLNYKNQINDAENELNKGYNSYNENLKNYYHGLEEFNNKKIDFEKKIAKAKEDINSLERPTWYVNIRMDNAGYASYINVSNSLKNLSKAFPTVFFIVAIFMSIMSMSRMALEDRGEIGSLKSLGFSNFNIMVKYVIYSSMATLIGGILGSLFGFYYLTYFIWKLYMIFYAVGTFKYHYDWLIIIVGILIGFICITGTTILTVKSIIKENAASLLRPKHPISGKNMFFENLSIWKRLKFSNKVTIRNTFRYKKRVLMTIIGIIGCTILLLTGYGIRDSVVNIPNIHFGEIMNYDDLIYYSSNYKFDNEILNDSHIKNSVNVDLLQTTVGYLNAGLQAVEDENNINSIFDFKSIYDGKEIVLKDDVIIISSKLASINNLEKGDKVKVIDNNNIEYELTISDIFENYIGHNIFMNKKTFVKYFGEFNINASYVKFDDIKNEESVIENLMMNDNVSVVISSDYTKNNINNMLTPLDSVVIILIVFSGMLSFVVLYNLSYINISERRREIASLKVLGFYDSEVDNYIIKENFIITLIGIVLGLILAKPFIYYIVGSVEIDIVTFLRLVTTSSYIKTFLFMLGFTIIVSFIIHFILKKISMIESLKSVE